jgi:hypothetical protein
MGTVSGHGFLPPKAQLPGQLPRPQLSAFRGALHRGRDVRRLTLDAVLVRNPAVSFIVPPCKGAVVGSTARTAPTQGDSHICSINEHRRMNWQKTFGYNRRSKVEAAIGRYKRLIGDACTARV